MISSKSELVGDIVNYDLFSRQVVEAVNCDSKVESSNMKFNYDGACFFSHSNGLSFKSVYSKSNSFVDTLESCK
jgi:hypothetical protein